MRKQCKRRPRGTGLPLVFGLTQSMRTDLDLVPLGTLESFREGTATELAAHTLAAAVNLAAVLAREYAEGDEVQRIVSEALKAVRAIFHRNTSQGSWGISGDEYKAIREALILSGELQGNTTRREVAGAIKQILREAGI